MEACNTYYDTDLTNGKALSLINHMKEMMCIKNINDEFDRFVTVGIELYILLHFVIE